MTRFRIDITVGTQITCQLINTESRHEVTYINLWNGQGRGKAFRFANFLAVFGRPRPRALELP